MEKILAPYLFGALVGFIAFYFIRKYKDYSSKSLKATLGVIALNFILPTIMVFVDAAFFYRYLIGVVGGVFLYVVYIIIVKTLKEKGRILDFEGFASCGMIEEEEETPNDE